MKLTETELKGLRTTMFRALRFSRSLFELGKLRKMSSVESKKPKIEVAPNTIGTHSGTFHCDEILACYLLSKHPDFAGHKVLRTRDQSLLDQCDIVVDVGNVFDPSKKRFDHHQNTFHETFSSLRPEFGEKFNVR